MSKYGVISGPYVPVFGLNTGIYGPGITPYLDTFHAVTRVGFFNNRLNKRNKTVFSSYLSDDLSKM